VNSLSTFISHVSEDSALAEQIRRALEKRGRHAFNPKTDIRAGENWRHAIRTAIGNADNVLVIISSGHAAANSWMGYEVGAAEALGKPVLTLASDRLSLSDLPEDLISRQIVHFDPQAPERGVSEVLDRLAPAKPPSPR